MNRILTVIRTIARYRLDYCQPPEKRSRILTFFLSIFPVSAVPANTPRGERIRRSLEELGPVFIKFGQLLSTRRDLLSNDIADELALLQDQVQPFSAKEAIKRIESDIGSPLDKVFREFDANSLAAASVAQVHSARLLDGTDVVVKVLRPGIDQTIKKDLRLLRKIARIFSQCTSVGRRLRLVEVIDEYERIILAELDLRHEAGNASQLRRNFKEGDLVYVPEIHWDLTCKTVMVSERIYGVPISDIESLKAKQINIKLLAERGVEIFFTQVFRDSFFHADMHPGNIFVDCTNPEDPRYIAVDCAIVGQLDDDDLHYLARNLLAIFKQDYRQVAKLHVECGWVPISTPLAEFESAMRTLCEPIFQRPLSEISFGQMLISLFRTAGQFEMQVQPQLVLLQKTLLNIEGVGRDLYPNLNLWDTAQPFLEQWVIERSSVQRISGRLQKEAPLLLELLPLLPDLISRRIRKTTPNLDNATAPHKPAYLAGLCGAVAMGISIGSDKPSLPWLIIGGLFLVSIFFYKTR